MGTAAAPHNHVAAEGCYNAVPAADEEAEAEE
jgi:hypothetical protein